MDAPMVAKELGILASNVYKILIRHGVDRRNKSDCHRLHDLNEGAFDVATPDALYWAGFLMADGSITSGGRSRSPTVTMDLAPEDREHVLAFRDFLGASHPVQERGESFRLQVRSHRLVEALGRWGVTAKKQAREEARGEAVGSVDFWRGVVDGDGSVSHIRVRAGVYPCINLLGSEILLQQFLTFLRHNGIPLTNRTSQKPGIRQVSIYGHAREVFRLLYGNATTFLGRKRAKGMAWPAGSAKEEWESIIGKQTEFRPRRPRNEVGPATEAAGPAGG